MTASEIHTRIQQSASGPTIAVTIVIPQEFAQLPPDQSGARLNALLDQIRSAPEFVVYDFQMRGAYEEPPTKEALFGHNTLVEVRLPYTLHLPSNVPFEGGCPLVRRK